MNATRYLSLLALTIFATGCATLPTFRGPPKQLAEANLAWPEGLHDFRGIIHCHSHLSHDSRGTFEEIQRACERVGVDFLIMTDHITPESVEKGLEGRRGRTLFIVGAEFSKGGGSILGLGMRESISKKLSTENTVSALHSQRALVFVGHAEGFQDWNVDAEGMEVYNIHTNAKQANKAGLIARALFLPPGTLFRSMIELHLPNFQRWDAISRQRRFVGIFGNDAHQNVSIFGPRDGYIGTYEQLFKIATTHVVASRLDRDAVMQALKDGHCYGALEIWGDTTGFAFTARNGERTLLMGDEAPFSPGWLFNIRLPAKAEIRIIHNGKEVFRNEQPSLTYQPPSPGVYRVEVWLKGKPWIFSNPIHLR